MTFWYLPVAFAVVALALAVLFYKFSPQKKFASRVLDLISYSLAAVGLISLSIAYQNYERRFETTRALYEIMGESSAIKMDMWKAVEKLCGAFQMSDVQTTPECKFLLRYGVSVTSVDPYLPAQFPVPPEFIGLEGSGPIAAFWAQFGPRVSKYNGETIAFHGKSVVSQLDRRAANEFNAIGYAILSFFVSVAIGLVRRIYDVKS
jgi:hypothetical protein